MTITGWKPSKGADGKGLAYRYTSAGRLYQRVWARGITTTYLTNTSGEVTRMK